MRAPVRVLLMLLAIVLVIGLAGFGYGFVTVRRPWPQTDGTIQVDNLQAEVTVIRDSWGIPHIYASNSHDLFFAQGYVHAQDRFWQMEFWRRIGSGRLECWCSRRSRLHRPPLGGVAAACAGSCMSERANSRKGASKCLDNAL